MSCEVTAVLRCPVSNAHLARLVDRTLRRLSYEPRTTEVSLAIVGDARMRTLNARYRGHRETTDVLSFPGDGRFLGEILISLPQARRQAVQYGVSLASEIELLVVHGLLHLDGHEHQRPAARRRMQALERRLLGGRSLIARSVSV